MKYVAAILVLGLVGIGAWYVREYGFVDCGVTQSIFFCSVVAPL